jgi:two-component system, NarL family, sensor kinase
MTVDAYLKLYIAVGTAVLLTMAIFIIVFVAYYQRRQAQQQLALKAMQAAHRRALMAATFQGQEQERKRLAQDLHDEIGTLLSVTKMSLNPLENSVEENPRAGGYLQKTRSLINDTMSNVRRISRDLVPTTLERFGLLTALEELIEKMGDSEVQITLDCPQTLEKLTPALELMFYRIAQELVNNAIKHARATSVAIELYCTPDQVLLSVLDNGQGFDLDEVLQDKRRGLGLRNIESRLSVVEGFVTFDVAPGRGSRIHTQVRLRESKPLPALA